MCESRASKVASLKLIDPDNAASFQVERSPLSLRVKDSAIDACDGSYGAVGLLLLKRSLKTIDTAMLASQYTRKGWEPSSTASHWGNIKAGGAESSASNSRMVIYMEGVAINLTPFAIKEVTGRMCL